MKMPVLIFLLSISHIAFAQPQITAEADLESVTVYTRGVEMNQSKDYVTGRQ